MSLLVGERWAAPGHRPSCLDPAAAMMLGRQSFRICAQLPSDVVGGCARPARAELPLGYVSTGLTHTSRSTPCPQRQAMVDGLGIPSMGTGVPRGTRGALVRN